MPLGTESEVARGALARVNPPGALGRRVCYVKVTFLTKMRNTLTDPMERPEDREELICFGRKLLLAELSKPSTLSSCPSAVSI